VTRTNCRPLSVTNPMLLFVLCASGVTGCGNAGVPGSERVATNTAAISESDQGLLDKTIVPVRPLVDPKGAYMKRIEETYPAAGSLLYHTVHVFNPTDGGTVRMSLSAKKSTGAIDTSHLFQSATVTPIIGRVPGSPQTFADSAGQATYTITGAAAGWYRLHFDYEAVNPNRTLVFTADNGASTSLKIAWMDPGGENLQVKATFTVDAAKSVFLKGGAYRNALPSVHAYADNIKVDGRLLYRRAFDQEQFNYPIGVLSAGDHVAELSFSKNIDGHGKFWFGVNETSFDLLGSKTTWAAAQFVYDGEMRTGDYDAWNEGLAFAQGPSLNLGVRPPPVRRGNMFTVSLDHSSLCGASMNAILRIYPFGNGSETNWPTQRQADSDYTGGIYKSSGFESHCRELWKVSIPANAPVGRYVLRAVSPSGVTVGGDVMFYVVHNPFSLVGANLASPGQIESYAYDDDFDGMNMEFDNQLDYDVDYGRDNFIAMFRVTGTHGLYNLQTIFSGAFRRTGAANDYSILDYAVAAAEGTVDEFDTMRRLYRIVSQRYNYGGSPAGVDVSAYFTSTITDPDASFTPEHARIYSKPGNELPLLRRSQAMCYTTAETVVSLARTCGLVSRAVLSEDDLGGWGDHGFAEVLIPNLPQHGGHTGPTASSPISDTDHWYVYDATSPQGGLPEGIIPWDVYSEAIAPRSQYGKTAFVLAQREPPFAAVTNYPAWNPYLPEGDTTTDVWDVTADYFSGPEFWLTGSTSGWLGRGEKDVYRISKSATGAKAVRVRTLPHDGEYLVPKLCVASGTNPVLTTKCADASTHYNLPNGDSYVVVFSDLIDLPKLRGDSIQYLIELEY
jgi:hypothetical protein